MKKIVLEQKETVSIEDIQTDRCYILVKLNNQLLNYTDEGLTYLVGGEPYEREHTLEELIEGGAEAYQIESFDEAVQWIKNNL